MVGGRRGDRRVATGLMLTCVEPTYSGWPSTNGNSHALSRSSARLSIRSRLQMPRVARTYWSIGNSSCVCGFG
ncbi:hypothetical protein VK92_14345 [Burkholderia sp. LK4]|nr:hypothetical protein VL00_20585 [Burkholderia cepacia]KML41013.1 hypothetical protein VL13_14400 [Burkholderia lata]KMN59834.1 hypothetical protein VK92_14345 [Burkholderia sp. LK4]